MIDPVEIASIVLGVARFYSLIGLAVAAAFLLYGIERVTEGAKGAWVFRPLLIPGLVLIWPIVLWRWAAIELGWDDWRGRHAPPRRTPGAIWSVLAIVIPLIFFGALILRQNGPLERPAVLLEPPAAEARP